MKRHGNAILWLVVLAGLVALAWWLYHKSSFAVRKGLQNAAAADLAAAKQIPLATYDVGTSISAEGF